MPRAPPVTIATLPLSFMVCSAFKQCRAYGAHLMCPCNSHLCDSHSMRPAVRTRHSAIRPRAPMTRSARQRAGGPCDDGGGASGADLRAGEGAAVGRGGVES